MSIRRPTTPELIAIEAERARRRDAVNLARLIAETSAA